MSFNRPSTDTEFGERMFSPLLWFIGPEMVFSYDQAKHKRCVDGQAGRKSV